MRPPPLAVPVRTGPASWQQSRWPAGPRARAASRYYARAARPHTFHGSPPEAPATRLVGTLPHKHIERDTCRCIFVWALVSRFPRPGRLGVCFKTSRSIFGRSRGSACPSSRFRFSSSHHPQTNRRFLFQFTQRTNIHANTHATLGLTSAHRDKNM
jgi:hypothetical protein